MNVPGHRIGSLGFRLPLSLFILLAFAPCAGGAQAPPPDALGTKNVLIFHSYEVNTPVFVRTDSGLSTALQSGGIPSINQFFESLDLRRNPGPAQRKLLVEAMRVRYSHRKLDMIVTMYPEALEFVLKDCRDILPVVPILAMTLPINFEVPKTDRLIIGHFARLDILGTLEIALKLVPGARRVYVVSGTHEVDRSVEAQARRDWSKWETRLEFIYLNQMAFEDMLATISSVPAGSIILALAFSQDVTGKSYTTPIVAQRLSQVSTAPIFGILDHQLGYGIAGGSLASFERMGTQAGQLVLNLLRGTQGSENTPALLDVPPVPMFDGRQLKRWDLSVDAVPPGSIIINREYTLWERYRTEVIVALFVLVVQALLIVSLVVNRAQRQLAERQLAEQLRIETLVAELSAGFVHQPAGQIEGGIQDAQRRICEVCSLDRSTLWQVPQDEPGTFRLMNFHTPTGTAPVPAQMDMRDFFPWAFQKIMRGETLTLSTLAALPPEATRDRETFQRYGTKSTVVIPLVADGTVLGALSFAVTRAEREWPDEIVKGFRMVAEVMANALARRRADQALRESQARLTLAVASADARLWEIEVDTGRMWMTEEGRRFFGFTPDMALALDDLAGFIHPDDRDSWRKSIQQALETAQPMRAEFRVVGVDGSTRWIASQGRFHGDAAERPRRLLGVSIDVTERKLAEERLRTSEALSTGVLASLPGHMVVVDRSGAIIRASDAWQTFAVEEGTLDPTVLAVSATPRQTSQRAGEEIGPVAKELLEGLEAVLAGMQTEFRTEYPFSTLTDERWANVTVLPLRRPEGGAVIYRQDITLQRRSRLEVEQLRRDLTHVARVTTMGEMAAALAHELNQPLTAILSNAHAGERYLAQPAPPLDEIREILQDVMGDARRAGEVIQRLRGMLRKEEPRFLPLDINPVIQEIVALVHTDAVLRNLEIDLDLAPALPSVRGDRVQLQQVLLNLVLNGMEAIGPYGEGRRVVIRTVQADGAVRVTVGDQGPGIHGDTLSRIFETFYTTKPNGMGMGLAISRSIVEAHGGRIWAENNPDRGATFSFTFPACPPDSSPA